MVMLPRSGSPLCSNMNVLTYDFKCGSNCVEQQNNMPSLTDRHGPHFYQRFHPILGEKYAKLWGILLPHIFFIQFFSFRPTLLMVHQLDLALRWRTPFSLVASWQMKRPGHWGCQEAAWTVALEVVEFYMVYGKRLSWCVLNVGFGNVREWIWSISYSCFPENPSPSNPWGYPQSSSILLGFPLINHPFWLPPLMDTPK